MRLRASAFLLAPALLVLVSASALPSPSPATTLAPAPPAHDSLLNKPAATPRKTPLSSPSPPLRDRPMTTAELFEEARAQSARLVDGGFVQFVEWFLVLLLVAPGTFPVITCVLLSCTTFLQRRLGISFVVPPPTSYSSAPVHSHSSPTTTTTATTTTAVLAHLVDCSSPIHRAPRPRSTHARADLPDSHELNPA